MSRFDCFIGIDWSGNGQAYQKGLQIAVAKPGSGAPILEAGPGPKGRWCRREASNWLGRLVREQKALIGLDFAFGFPSICDLIDGLTLNWEYVELLCAAAKNFYGGQFFRAETAHEAFITSRWHKGKQCSVRPLRTTEKSAKALKGATPQSVFVAIGPAQVGLSSVSGMRVLRHIKKEHTDFISIWPFDEVDARRSVIVEVFPRYFPLLHKLSPKMSDHKALNAALAAFGSAPTTAPPSSEDEGDAVMIAAALRSLSTEEVLFKLPDMSIRNEGWIFGVPVGDSA